MIGMSHTRGSLTKVSRNRLLILAVLVAMITVTLPVPQAEARSARLGYFHDLYDASYNTVGASFDNCGLCHGASNSVRNPYGADIEQGLIDLGYTSDIGRASEADVKAVMTALEASDSDGDTFSNIVEIAALTHPGDASDFPVANTPPTADDQSVATDEDNPLGITLTAADADGDPLTWSVGTAANGTLSGTAPNLTYTPNPNYNGGDSFTFSVNDGTVDSSTATVSITVNAVNDAPTADDLSVTTDEDVPVGIALSGADIDGDTLTFSVVSGPSNGALSGTPPNLTYTPTTGFFGADSFNYVANDGTIDSTEATVTITVNFVNVAPVAADDAYATDEDAVLNVTAPGVLSNDTDADGDPLTAALVVGPADGSLTLNGDGSFDYTPNANYNGPDSFTYLANDGTTDSNVATVSITVNSVNDAPVADANGPYSGVVDVLVLFDGSGSFDLDGTIVSYSWDFGDGSLGTGVNPTHTYTTAANYSVTLTVTDDGGLTDVATSSAIISEAPNQDPVALDDPATTDEDTAVLVDVLANDTDPNVGDVLSVTAVTQGTNGAVTNNGTDVTYTPNPDFNGADSFTYTVSDGNGGSDIATVTITVNAINDAPVAADDAYTTDEDSFLNPSMPGVLGNDADADGDPLTAALVTGPANGTLTLLATGEFAYTPDADFNGSDSFTYVANDGTVDSNTATVSITVNAVNDAPVAADDAYSVDEDVVLSVAAPGVLANDTDVMVMRSTAIGGWSGERFVDVERGWFVRLHAEC